jgi:diguanylate cyclase (GGDEF)-like protein
MRIRTVALLLTGGIGLVTFAGIASIYGTQRNYLKRLDETKSLVHVIGDISRFVEAMALERGVYNQLLVSEQRSENDVAALATPRVEMTDRVFADSESDLSRLPGALRQPIDRFIQKARSELSGARSDFRNALPKGQADRISASEHVVKRFLEAAGFIDEAIIQAEREVSDREPRIGLIVKNPRLANEMREAAGQRSTILSRYVGTRVPFDDDARDKVSELTGAVHGAWIRLQRLSRQAGDTPRLEEAIENIRTKFMMEGEPIYEGLARDARQGLPPRMGLQEWRAWTVKMLTVILQARDAPIAQALDDISSLETHGRDNATTTIASFLCALVVLLAIGYMLEGRVLRPLNVLTGKLDVDQSRAGSSEDSETIHQYTSRSDEIGALARALERRRHYEKQITHLARHDFLTDLPNRALFREELKRALANCARDSERVAVLCLDLDRFKPVNDTLGHAAGDELLKQVARRLLSCVRTGDLAARLGGDEFGVILPRVDNDSAPQILAERIVQELTRSYNVLGHDITLGTSIGIAMGAAADLNPDTLVHQADLALYRAKAEAGQCFRFYHPEMDTLADDRRRLEVDLRQALEKQQFELHFQPIVRLQDNSVISFEALIRWRHPERGLVSPAAFIPLAEETGLINPIGQWVLAEACQQAATWPAHIGVAVNLSSVQFRQPSLPLQVVTALTKSGLEPSRLELEITEAVLLHDSEATRETLLALRAIGVRIALDDFGTGYSSLSYLSQFEFDKIKIDRSFINDLSSGSASMAIIRAVAALGLELGISVTAEGVESEEQLESVRAIHCTEVQGFLFGRPTAAQQLDRFLEEPRAKSSA